MKLEKRIKYYYFIFSNFGPLIGDQRLHKKIESIHYYTHLLSQVQLLKVEERRFCDCALAWMSLARASSSSINNKP